MSIKLNLSIKSGPRLKAFFQYSIFISFLVIVFTVWASIAFKNCHYIIIFPILFFLVYDVLFWKEKKRWCRLGRDYKTTLRGIRAAIQYTTILFGFIGIAFGSFLDESTIGLVIELFREELVLQYYAAAMVVIITVLLLFIPITYIDSETININEHNKTLEPSQALKNYHFMVLFLQKALILLSVYIIITIGLAYYNSLSTVEVEVCRSVFDR